MEKGIWPLFCLFPYFDERLSHLWIFLALLLVFPFLSQLLQELNRFMRLFFCGSSSRSRCRTLPLLLYILYVVLCANNSLCVLDLKREIFFLLFYYIWPEPLLFPFLRHFLFGRRFSPAQGQIILCGSIKVQFKIFWIIF